MNDNSTCTNTIDGINLYSSNYNTLTDNKSYGNTVKGIYINASDYEFLSGNYSYNNSSHGISLASADNNKFFSNILSNNKTSNGYGIYISASVNNYFAQNTIDSNQNYGIYITGTCTSDTFEYNNLLCNPALAVYNNYNGNFNFYNNYWNTTDSSLITAQILGASTYENKILRQPFSFNIIDTTVGADTIAPEVVTISGFDTSAIGAVTVNWTASASADVAGYNIFRAGKSQLLTSGDTNNWYAFYVGTALAPATGFSDNSGFGSDTIYYYRVLIRILQTAGHSIMKAGILRLLRLFRAEFCMLTILLL